MAFYSDEKVKTEILDPHNYQENERVEFRLDQGTILNNLKIGNLGAVAAGTPRYNLDAGALGLIKKISLFDGAVTLQEQSRANEHYAFTNSLKSNSENSDIGRFRKHHTLGFTMGAHRDGLSTKDIEINYAAGNTVPAADSANNTIKGYVDIKELLPIVSKMECLSAKVFPQLRLVIEYETDIRNSMSNNANPITTTRPFLIVDKVTDETLENTVISKLESFNFMNYEWSEFTMPAVTNNVTSQTVQKVMAYNGKFLNRLRLKYNLSNAAQEIDGNALRFRGVPGGSLNFKDRKVQYRINGKNRLPRANVEGDMRRLALLTDVYGPLNVSYEEVQAVANTDNQNGLITFGDNVIGSKDYDAILVGDRIEDLQVEVQRIGITDATVPSRYNDALRVSVEGEVVKQFIIEGGSYDIKYL